MNFELARRQCDGTIMVHKKSISLIWVTVALALILLCESKVAHALSFAPTEQEWNSWSDVCRARYTVSGAGEFSKYSSRVSKAEVAKYEAQVGYEGWLWLHHYCAGIIYLDRAQNAESDLEAKKWLREADVNIKGQYNRLSKTHYMFPELTITMARLYREMGDTAAAIGYLEEAMRYQPRISSPYAQAALIYREDGDLESALEVLLKGDAATDGTSAELHFFLGHLYIQIGDLDSAVAHAERAYELGYPLPGLATKLRRLGRSVNP